MSNNFFADTVAAAETALTQYIGAMQINRHLGSIVSDRGIHYSLFELSVGRKLGEKCVDDEVGELHSTVLRVCYARGLRGKQYCTPPTIYSSTSCRCMHKLCARRTAAESIEPRAGEIYR